MIRIILNGCNGRMGKTITETLSGNENMKITVGIDKGTSMKSEHTNIFSSITEVTSEADVILDFSSPESLDALLEYATVKKLPLVLCTTGYTELQYELIRKTSSVIPIFHSGNMSLGINILNAVLRNITPVLFGDYDIEIIEKHHNQKIDAPSGTALLLANTIKTSIDEKTDFIYGREGLKKREKTDIGIHAVRGGSIVGEHEVIFAGKGEIIELKHTALSREVFAVGAVKACQFIVGKDPGLYNMDDVLS